MILSGRELYDSLKEELKSEFDKVGPTSLASLVVKSDYSLDVYLAAQEKLAQELGVEYELIEFEEHVKPELALQRLKELNEDDKVGGIIANKPFPQGWEEDDIFSAIDPTKDVEGVNPHNLGNVVLGKPRFIPPTVLSVLEFLKISGVDLYGKEITLVGFSAIIGKPLAIILADRLATVSITHIATYEADRLPFYIDNADIVISAVGKPHLIKGDWIKKGAVVIDVGTGEKDGKLTGDVEFDMAKEKASYITPVPGGVGKLTTIFLFQNLLKAIKGGLK